jgi:hypothetical protein
VQTLTGIRSRRRPETFEKPLASPPPGCTIPGVYGLWCHTKGSKPVPEGHDTMIVMIVPYTCTHEQSSTCSQELVKVELYNVLRRGLGFVGISTSSPRLGRLGSSLTAGTTGTP